MAEPEDQSDDPIAEVALNVPLDRTFDYLLPDELRGRVPVGGRVRVPFGPRKSELGYCVGLKQEPGVDWDALKPVKKSLDVEPVFTPRMLRLTAWIARYYHCAWGEALHAALPGAVRRKRKRRKLQFACLTFPAEQAEQKADEIFDSSPAQAKILRALGRMGGDGGVAEVTRSTSTSRSSVKALKRKELLTIDRRVVEGEDPLTEMDVEPTEPPEFTDEQKRAYDSITGRLKRGHFGVILLHGVTSSGKTEVYLQSIAKAVEQGKQAIVLVPEISLTPQMVRRFLERFERLAVLHSQLTESDRRRYWHQIQSGEADVVVGARSAIFAPVPNLGLLVIDEEHENSFKQDSTPRYHARDVGIMRAKMDDALVVLGSATPSLESYHNSETGKYKLVRLTRRIGERPMPPVEVVDMRDEWRGHKQPRVISHRLESCMRDALTEGEQIILFMNRRGYSPFIRCPRCGFVLQCPRCDITLKFHRKINVVKCHFCNYEQRPPKDCPECGLEGIRYGGAGTEKIEEAVERLFPDAAYKRMDSDTMQARGSHEKALDAFKEGDAQILIGTQMIAKGLDFPTVTTVGVINADVALHMPDFRSRERTFQLLAQVAGRAGRGERGGRVIVQTFLPSDPSIKAAAEHDYERFARMEMPLRRSMGYPPFGRMARIICRGRKEEQIREYMHELATALRDFTEDLDDGAHVLGPSPAPVSRIKRRYRYHLMLKCPNSSSVHDLLDKASGLLKGPSGAKVLVDVDPISML